MAPPPNTLDRAFEMMKASWVETLAENAADAVIAGEVRASNMLRLPINFSLVSTRAVAATTNYRNSLVRFGGSEVTEIVNGRPTRVFKAWLNDAIEKDREQIGAIIDNAIREGKSLREVEQGLDEVFAMREHNAKLTAYQETKALYNKGTMDRFQHENIQRGIWHHMDPQDDPREEHQELDGKVFDLDDPVWDLLNEPNCHCYCEPVLTLAGGSEE